MKRTILFLLALAATISGTLSLRGETRRRYTVTTKAAAPHAAAMRMVANAGEKPLRMRTFANVNGFAADLTEEEVAELRDTAGITSVDPVVERWASDLAPSSRRPGDITTNLENYDQQILPWGLPVIHAAEVWPVTRGEGINVAIIDTGIDYSHPDLKAAYVGGYNVYDAAKLPIDDNFHGTHVAGIIAATDNAFGVVGAAPGVRLWIVKALDETGKSYDEYIAAGIDWVVGKQREVGGRWVVNMSLGAAAEGGKLEKAAVVRAADAGIVLVAAAGNRGTAFLDFPAAYDGVIPVGAIGEDGRRAEFSSWGPRMDVVAPGVKVQSTFLDGSVSPLAGELSEQADVVTSGQSLTALGLLGSPKGQITGKLVDCKLGEREDIPPTVAGNIALIRRGTIDFREKARNAKEAGAASVIIWDHVPSSELKRWTMWPKGCPTGPQCGPEWENYTFPVTVGVTYEDGQKLLQHVSSPAQENFVFARYGRLSGTSMATPHVASTAALLLSLDPTLKPIDIMFILKHTARDTADPGWDFETGYGIVDALAAAQFVAPDKFGLPPPDYKPGRRRTVRP
ncbi:MAG: S8 family serine peptidase [Acidobacteriota bacterium]